MKPRLAFLGTGWIGLGRMEKILKSGHAEAALVFEPNPEMMAKALALVPGARPVASVEEIYASDVDGVVIASPSALHAEQSIRALDSGKAVFCQKPLGRHAEETRAVLEAARRADRLLEVDLSYRFTRGMRIIAERLRGGDIGRLYAMDLTFHNAYGPDKPWFYDRKLSGGGCVMDLGIHLVDLALMAANFPAVEGASSRLFAGGAPLTGTSEKVEDYAVVRLDLAGGLTAQLACSWRLSAGVDAVINATFYGTEGALCFKNVNGSFYDFVAERYRGTSRETLFDQPDDWGGAAGVHWAEKLAQGGRYDPAAAHLEVTARALDAIYRQN